MEENVIAATQ